MLIVVSTGTAKQYSGLGIPPAYKIRITRLKDFVDRFTSLPNFANGATYIHFVGKDKMGSMYNLFAIGFGIDKRSSYIYEKLAFLGNLPELAVYPWYYLDPGANFIDINLASMTLGDVTNDLVVEATLQDRTLTITHNGSILLQTSLPKDPITLDEIWVNASAYDSVGSPISATNFGLLVVDVIQQFDISTVLPIVVAVAAAASVVGLVVTAFSKLAK